MFWALEQRRKWRAKWKEEGVAAALVESYAESYSLSAIEMLLDAPAEAYAEISAKAYARGFSKGVHKAMQNLEERMTRIDLPPSYRAEFRQAVETYLKSLAREKGLPIEAVFPSETGIPEARAEGYTDGRAEAQKELKAWLDRSSRG